MDSATPRTGAHPWSSSNSPSSTLINGDLPFLRTRLGLAGTIAAPLMLTTSGCLGLVTPISPTAPGHIPEVLHPCWKESSPRVVIRLPSTTVSLLAAERNGERPDLERRAVVGAKNLHAIGREMLVVITAM